MGSNFSKYLYIVKSRTILRITSRWSIGIILLPKRSEEPYFIFNDWTAKLETEVVKLISVIGILLVLGNVSIIEKLTKKFDTMSKDAEQKVKDILSSEEAMKLREELAKIDKDAIDQAKNKMIAELNELLALTEEQAQKLKPVLEDSFNQLAEKIQEVAKEGSRDWNDFMQDLEKMTKDLYDKVQETLDDEQLEKLEEYNNDQKEDIKKALLTA